LYKKWVYFFTNKLDNIIYIFYTVIEGKNNNIETAWNREGWCRCLKTEEHYPEEIRPLGRWMKEPQLNASGANKKIEEVKLMSKDRLIKENLVATIEYNKVFSDATITVEVQDGKVTLLGKVYDRKQKEMIGEIARELDGVTEVENQLAIEEPEITSLTEIDLINSKNISLIAEVKTALYNHPSLNAAAIAVVSAKRPGVFYLKGSTVNEAERDTAEAVADAVKGIRYVINDLTVDPAKVAAAAAELSAAGGESGDKSLMEKYAVDSQNLGILAEVKKKLLQDPRLDATNIAVTAEPFEVGIFHLTGSVPTEADKKAAEAAARQARGVRYIANDLEVVA